MRDTRWRSTFVLALPGLEHVRGGDVVYWNEILPLLALIACVVGLIATTQFLKILGVDDGSLNILRGISTALGAGLVTYIGYLFFNTMKKGSGPQQKP